MLNYVKILLILQVFLFTALGVEMVLAEDKGDTKSYEYHLDKSIAESQAAYLLKFNKIVEEKKKKRIEYQFEKKYDKSSCISGKMDYKNAQELCP